MWNTVAVVPLLLIAPRYLPAGSNTAIYRQPTQLSQCCRCWVFLLSVSSDFKGAIADNLHSTQSPPQVDHYYTSTYIHIFILSRYPGTMTVCFKVLGSQCYCSMYYCCCIPEIHVFLPKRYRPIIHQDKHYRLSKTATLLPSRTAPKIYEYSNS